MKKKFGNIVYALTVLAIISIIVVTVTMYVSSHYTGVRTKLGGADTSGEGGVTGVAVTVTYNTTGATYSGTASLKNKDIIDVTDEYPVTTGEMLANAVKLLGVPYGFGAKGINTNGGELYISNNQSYSRFTKEEMLNGKTVDCSGYVDWVLFNSGIKTNNFYINNPIDTPHYYTDGTQRFSEARTWRKLNGTAGLTEINVGGNTSVGSRNLSYTKDGNTYKVNVLKLGDPISSELRYYQYYDANNTLQELPAGTVIVSDAKALAIYHANAEVNPGDAQINDHMWIYIGDLGTADAEEAYNVLKQRYGLDFEYNESYMYSRGDSHHWKIEASGNNTAGVGVKITNEDPEQMEYGINTKGIGPVWAFQFTSDNLPETVEYVVEKIWDDEDNRFETRPDSIQVQLLADGQACGDPVTLNGNNGWKYTWTELDKEANGNEITYSIQELSNVKGYTTSYSTSGNKTTINNKLTTDTDEGTGTVGLYKYEDTNRNGRYDEGEPSIEGAEFKIATSEENANNGVFLKDTTGNDIVATSGKDGTAKFEDLEFDEETLENAKYTEVDEETGEVHYKYHWDQVETTYYIIETKAPEGYKEIEGVIEAEAKKDYYKTTDISTLIKVGNKKKIYDLALRKFITKVNDGVTGEESKIILDLGDEEEISRVPKIDVTDLASGKSTTAKYDHIKTPVLVHTTDVVTYTIQVYNEGTEDAYAAGIKDDIPEGLEFVQYTEGDGSINDTYGWKLVDENDNFVTDVSKAKYIVTDYLAKDSAEKKLIKAFDKDTMKEPDSRYVKVQFKVTEPTTSDRIITNSAQISKETDASGRDVTDRDSTANVWKNEDDEDVEHVRVLYFDLALRKWVTQAIVTDEKGATKVMETGHKAEDDPEEVVKVDLKKSKVDKVTVKFKYSIRITNQGEIPGEATEIRDDVPAGLMFLAEDNPDWKLENGKVVTNKLANTTLKPGESAEVELILTWINGKENLGVKNNIAEINKDHNDYGTKDIDSTPGNNVPGEDDIDDAPVMLSIVTGSEMIKYVALVLGIATIVMVGAVVTKRVLKKEDNF